MMNATAFARPDVRARPIKAAALGVMTGGVRPGPFGHGPVAAADRVRPLPPPAARVPPTGGPRGESRPAARCPRHGFPRQVAREGDLGQAAQSHGSESPDGWPARGISARRPPPVARNPLTGGPRGEFDP